MFNGESTGQEGDLNGQLAVLHCIDVGHDGLLNEEATI